DPVRLPHFRDDKARAKLLGKEAKRQVRVLLHGGENKAPLQGHGANLEVVHPSLSLSFSAFVKDFCSWGSRSASLCLHKLRLEAFSEIFCRMSSAPNSSSARKRLWALQRTRRLLTSPFPCFENA